MGGFWEDMYSTILVQVIPLAVLSEHRARSCTHPVAASGKGPSLHPQEHECGGPGEGAFPCCWRAQSSAQVVGEVQTGLGRTFRYPESARCIAGGCLASKGSIVCESCNVSCVMFFVCPEDSVPSILAKSVFLLAA